ncbi:MAG: Tex-like N-terminal domain-containing protein [Saprospiraceae bacterium]
MQIVSLVSRQVNIAEKQVAAALKLMEEGATIPFIARYRKEVTGELDEVELTEIQRAGKRFEDMMKRKETILAAIAEQGKLTPALAQRIRDTYDDTVLEDLYLPYKRKRKTRAGVARERGLEPLALLLMEQQIEEVEKAAAAYINEEVPNAEDALAGARDIIAEILSEDEKIRNTVRKHFRQHAVISCKVARGKDEEAAKYQDYFDYTEALKNCPSHRMLAIRRGEDEGLLRVIIAPEDEPVLADLAYQTIKGTSASARQVKMAMEDGYQRLICLPLKQSSELPQKKKPTKKLLRYLLPTCDNCCCRHRLDNVPHSA